MGAERRRTGSTRRAARVFVSGMGGELGSLVAAKLEREPWVASVTGCDVDPPRRRLRDATFHLIEPHERTRTAALVQATDPHVIVHVGVYEPGARANPGSAVRRSLDAVAGVLGACADAASLQSVVVRSGLEIYGRARVGAARTSGFDESMAAAPTSTFGRSLAVVEQQATTFAAAAGVPIACVRLAPVIGAHIPSPLGRLLRLPAVPFDPTRRVRFSVIDLDDAADALIGAVRLSIDGPVNVAGAGSISPLAAIKLGSRFPLPVVGPGWWPARHVAGVVGAPLPDHVVELLQHGRLAVTDRARLLGLDPARSTVDALRALHAWPAVTHVRTAGTARVADTAGAASTFADGARPVSLRIVHG